MISAKSFLEVNQELCEKNHNCNTCPLYGDEICCVFRCKSSDDITKVVNSISKAEAQFLKDAMESAPILPITTHTHPEDVITKALKDIKNELHDMKKIMDKRRS